MATLFDKQDELTSFLEETINGVAPKKVRTSTRYRDTRGLDPHEIAKIAGDPINYLEVLYQGNLEGVQPGTGQQPNRTRHTFRVSYFYKYEDTDQNEDLWRSLTYEDGGIIPKVNETSEIGSGATWANLGAAEGDVMDVVPFGPDLPANMLTFQVDVI